jgi:hypothetical protein
MAEKIKFTSFVSAAGIAKYAWLDKPDPYQLEKGKTEFKLRILLDDNEETRAWVNKVLTTAKADAAKAGVKLKKVWHNPFKMPEDQDEDDYVPAEGKDKPRLDADHQGRIFFEAKTGFVPALLGLEKDEKGNLIALAENVRIMSGDRVKVKFTLNPYEGLGSGVSFRLNAVQLVKKASNFVAGTFAADEFGSDEFAGDEDQNTEVPF